MGKFDVTLDCFIDLPIGKLVDSMRGNPDVIPTKLPLRKGNLDPHLIHGYLGPPRSISGTASLSV